MEKVRKAVVPVAGFGTRFLPITKTVPKMMLPIVDKPILQIIAQEAADSGIEEILFIVGSNGDIIKDYFTPDKDVLSRLNSPQNQKRREEVEHINEIAKYSFLVQEERLGTAHAVSLAREFVAGEPFLVMYGDDLMYSRTKPVSRQLIDAYLHTGKTVLGCKHVPKEDVCKYASVEYGGYEDNIFFATKITEKPSPDKIKSTLAPLGRYVCSPDIFSYIERIKMSESGEYQLTDAFDFMAKEGKVVACLFDGDRFDTGNKLGYLKAVTEFALRNGDLGEEYLQYLKELLK